MYYIDLENFSLHYVLNNLSVTLSIIILALNEG
jgi:hypothetical protein